MPRSDLLIRLVESGMQCNKVVFRKVVESIIAEERSKQHNIIANKLFQILQNPKNDTSNNYNLLVDQRESNLVYEAIPQRQLSELILNKGIIEIFDDIIDEHNRKDILRSYNMEPRNRILLIGPPGNGKTSLAEAFANALMIPFLIVRYEGIIGSYLGETAIRIKKLMDYVATKNCVLFFDEFETLGKERGDIHETGEIKRVVSSLLLQIDNLPSNVVVIGATNHAELLDRAVWRRFQIKIKLNPPTKLNLLNWWNNLEKKLNFKSRALYKHFLLKYGNCSFSEIEEFGNTVHRQYVLQQPTEDIIKIIKKTLRQYSK